MFIHSIFYVYICLIGISSGIISELYSLCLNRIFPQLQLPYINHSIPIPNNYDIDNGLLHTSSPSKKSIRLGIIPEHFGNSSPGLCIQNILIRLASYCNGKYSPLENCDISNFHIIFFDRTSLHTLFAGMYNHDEIYMYPYIK